jgi:beta-glucanase (GH16 family)
VRTVESFNFRYGTLEIEAKLPKGDWIWPAIWLLPELNAYGQWPASGEIDFVEARGNPTSCPGGRNEFGSTLHWGPGYPMDAYLKGHTLHTGADLSADFHNYKMEWNEHGIKTFIDNIPVLDFNFDQDMFDKGGFPQSVFNPWQYESPF